MPAVDDPAVAGVEELPVCMWEVWTIDDAKESIGNQHVAALHFFVVILHIKVLMCIQNSDQYVQREITLLSNQIECHKVAENNCLILRRLTYFYLRLP